MEKIIAKKDFVLEGKQYIVGDELDVNDIKIIKTLNEGGYIEPLSYRDLVLIERELKEI